VDQLAEVLRKAGYRRVVLLTQSRGAKEARNLPLAANIRTSLKGLLEDRSKEDTVLVALAGHGVQFKGSDENFFCPMDARLADKQTLLSLGEVYRQLEQCQAGAKVLLVDACRNDPQSDFSRARAAVTLESVTRPQQREPPGGVAAFFSCSAGEKAFESPTLKRGIFFHFIIEGLQGKADANQDGTVDLDELVLYTKRRVADRVKEEHGDDVRQMPELVGKTRGLLALVSRARSQDDDWIPLFNGKDLTGWKTHPTQRGDWHVKNGTLIASGPSITSHLYTVRDDYRNFHLRLEARINEGGNSGVYFRTPFGPAKPANEPRWLVGYNAKIDGKRLGGFLIDDPTGTSPLVRSRAPSLHAGQWLTLEVIAEGNHFVVKTNGETTADYTDHANRFTKGHIALQQHTPQTVVEFRKVAIKELPP
jgi:hypothetical protein